MSKEDYTTYTVVTTRNSEADTDDIPDYDHNITNSDKKINFSEIGKQDRFLASLIQSTIRNHKNHMDIDPKISKLNLEITLKNE